MDDSAGTYRRPSGGCQVSSDLRRSASVQVTAIGWTPLCHKEFPHLRRVAIDTPQVVSRTGHD